MLLPSEVTQSGQYPIYLDAVVDNESASARHQAGQ